MAALPVRRVINRNNNKKVFQMDVKQNFSQIQWTMGTESKETPLPYPFAPLDNATDLKPISISDKKLMGHSQIY